MHAKMWNLPMRVAFRFGFVAGALYVYPFPFGFIPKTELIAEALGAPWKWLTVWFGESILGFEQVPTDPTGSGDTAYAWTSMLLIVILGALGAAVWSALDRKRVAYPRLASASVIVLRYVLAFTMLSYGLAKIINTQFPPPTPIRLESRIGEMSPMGLLWTFMGYSTPYTMFAGLCEALGGVLLLWRRTTVLGAFVVAAVMTNVMMMNFCYDVPVKLYSAQLLIIAGIIAMPHVRRVLAAMLGYATAAVPDRLRLSARRELARKLAKAAFLLAAAISIAMQVVQILEYRGHPHELEGIWSVETWSADGADRPPLATDKERWRRIALATHGIAIRTMTDERKRAGLELDAIAKTIAVKTGEQAETWRYSQPDPQHLLIDGKWDGKQLHVTLVREPDSVLVSRGFNWIQEVPFNR